MFIEHSKKIQRLPKKLEFSVFLHNEIMKTL
jgi:hypothetical protein